MFFNCAYSQAKRAQNFIEKQKYVQAEILLQKAVKAPLSAGEKYVYSVLLLMNDYPRYNIDSGYYYILGAVTDYEKSNEKTLEKLDKEGFDFESFIAQKNMIESLAFTLTKSADSEADYVLFLEKYTTSPEYDSAIWYRNERAFEAAAKRNIWERYKSFMDKYPDAERYQEAKEKYELLLYQDRTNDGKLESLEKFLKEHPDTPYRNEVEEKIFRISTGNHNIDRYKNFVSNYPESPFAEKSAARILLLIGFPELSANEPELLRMLNGDSLELIYNLNTGFLYTTYQNDGYIFRNQSGQQVGTTLYKSVPVEYLCGNIEQTILIVGLKGQQAIINRAGQTILTDAGITEVQDLGAGVLKYKQDGQFGSILKTGEVILTPEFENIRLLQNQFVGFKENGKWGLASVNGIILFTPQFDDIDNLETLIRFDKNGNFALVKPVLLIPLLEGVKIDLEYTFTDVDILDSNRLILYSGEKQSLIFNDLTEVIPMDDHEIIELVNGYLIEVTNGYHFVTDEIEMNSALVWKDVEYNEEWTGLRGPNGWVLISATQKDILEEHLDSLKILNHTAVLIYKNGERSIRLSNGVKLNLQGGRTFQVISSPPTTSTTPSYYYTIHQLKKSVVINQAGDTLNLPEYNTLTALGNEYLVFSSRRKKGLADYLGNVLLAAKYDGIANYSEGYVTTLNDGKLGLYRVSDKTNIPPQYDKSLTFYSNNLLIAIKKGEVGLIDRNNNIVVKFDFEEIRYFNNSAAWVKKDELWSIYNFADDKFSLVDISAFEPIDARSEDHLYVQSDRGKGVLHKKNGMIIKASFHEIINIGSVQNPVFLAEKFVEEADYHVIVIYDKLGNILFRNAYNNIEFENVFCGDLSTQ